MGASFFLQWFGKSSTELKAIREQEANTLTEQQLKVLDNMIAKKEQKENEQPK